MLVDVAHVPGTIKDPQHTKITQRSFTDTNHVHFPDESRLSTIDPYNAIAGDLGSVELLGAVREIYAAQLSGTHEGSYYFLASNKRLMVRKNGRIFNITPLRSTSDALATDPINTVYDSSQTNPFGTTNGSNVVLVYTAAYDSFALGDNITISGVGSAVNGIPAADLNGTHAVISLNASSVSIRVDTAASSTGNPAVASVIIKANLIEIEETGHSIVAGDRIKISGASGTIAGIPDTQMNKEHVVSQVRTNSYFVPVTSTPTGSAAGGGASVVRYKQIADGNLNQSGASGFGIGEYGAGIFGEDSESSAAQSYPRIWSIDSFGNEIVMCPGDYTTGDGQKIYIWDGDTDTAPTVLTNAPTDCNYVMVVNNHVVALCGRTIKISEQGEGTVWSGLLYYEKTLERVWKLISGVRHGEKDAVIGHPMGAVLLRYVGGADLWDLSDLDVDDGFISPKAAARLVESNGGTSVYWMGRRGIYGYDGGKAYKVANTQNESWIIKNINNSALWTTFTAVDQQNAQVWFFFPVGADTNPGDYVIFNPAHPSFTLGQMDRTAAQRPGFVDGSYYMANATSATVGGTMYAHFVPGSVTFNWYAVEAESFLGKGDARFTVRRYMHDASQEGDVTVDFYSREYPNAERVLYDTITATDSSDILPVSFGGRLLSMKFSGSAACTLGTPKIDVVPLGAGS